MNPGQAKCGAATRKGTECKDIAMANGRCKRHGGKSTGPKSPKRGDENPANKFGIYGNYYSDEEKVALAAIVLGNVDAELGLVRIRLKRTLEARAKWETEVAAGRAKATDDSFTFVEQVDDENVTKDGDVVPTTKKTFRLPDFDKIEQTCLVRIESLERTRKELLKVDPDDPSKGAGVTIEGGLPSDEP